MGRSSAGHQFFKGKLIQGLRLRLPSHVKDQATAKWEEPAARAVLLHVQWFPSGSLAPWAYSLGAPALLNVDMADMNSHCKKIWTGRG